MIFEWSFFSKNNLATLNKIGSGGDWVLPPSIRSFLALSTTIFSSFDLLLQTLLKERLQSN
jgi:hypothetical protein